MTQDQPCQSPFVLSLNRMRKGLDYVQQLVDPVLQSSILLENRSSFEIVEYSLLPKGERERPYLMKLAAEACDGDFGRILDAAAAIELLHFSTLVLDDVLDSSQLRRHIATAASQFGQNKAIAAGELLAALSYKSLLRTATDDGADQTRVIRSLSILSKTHADIYEGQLLDLIYERDLYVTEKQYYGMIRLTTGSLVSCSMRMAAILSGADSTYESALADYGSLVGVAMQMRDDLDEVIYERDLIGKQPGGDIKQGKMRLPVILALRLTEGERRRTIEDTIRSTGGRTQDIHDCLRSIRECGAIDLAKQRVNETTRRAIECLTDIPNTDARDRLEEFAIIIGRAWQ